MKNALNNPGADSRITQKSVEDSKIYVRVILIEQYGTLHTMWLSDTREGRYRFWEDTREGGSLPIYIE